MHAFGRLSRFDGKDGTRQLWQLENFLLQTFSLFLRNRNQHHERKVRGSQSSSDRFTHVSAHLDDEARHIRYDTEAIRTRRVDDQIDTASGREESGLEKEGNMMRDCKNVSATSESNKHLPIADRLPESE